MPTKTKTSINNKRGRPKKEFTVKKKTTKTTEVKRGRGRPKKATTIKKTDSVNTRISKHSKEIKKLSQEHKKIHLDIKNSSFSSKKLKKNENTRSDRFALGLLIFSMLLFIFSLYKTFYLNTDNSVLQEINSEIIINTGSTMIKDVSKNRWELKIENWEWITFEDNKNIENEDTNNKDVVFVLESQWINVIENFYKKINDKKFEELSAFVDNYIKSSSVFNIYYTQNWMWNFLSHLTNEKLYITNLRQLESQKEWVEYYTYTIKYKLQNNNQMFEEEWKVAIVERWGEKLIWSIQCTNTGCSKMPFFNPQLHWIR